MPINERGRDAGARTARGVRDSGFACVYTSPLIRALETAEIIAALLRLPPPVCHDGLKERNFGVIQGIPKAELAELNPSLLEHIVKRNPDTRFEQGESMDECADPCARGRAGHRPGKDPGERVLAITHGWAMDVLTRAVRGLPRSAMLHHKPKNGESLWLEATPLTIRPPPAAS